MVAGWPVRMPNWLKIASRMTASATHRRICFVRSFKFHLQPSHVTTISLASVRRTPADGRFPTLHHPKLPRQQIDLGTAGS